jgi:hypothetical protein
MAGTLFDVTPALAASEGPPAPLSRIEARTAHRRRRRRAYLRRLVSVWRS